MTFSEDRIPGKHQNKEFGMKVEASLLGIEGRVLLNYALATNSHKKEARGFLSYSHILKLLGVVSLSIAS